MLIPDVFENSQIFRQNTMPDRAYYVPASAPLADPVRHREASDRLILLSGPWRFRYEKSVRELTVPFWGEDFCADGFDTVPVPSVWQNHGYDGHQYTNVLYPFPVDPPYVPWDDPCGIYLRDFDYTPDPAAPRAFLNFEGVDSCAFVWLNGQYIGFSEVSHANVEYEVTRAVRPGCNRLAVLVLKWCAGSYVEDQDKFRTSGIFRDVYLLLRPEKHLRDYTVAAEPQPDGTGRVSFRGFFDGGAVPVKLSLFDADGATAAEAELGADGTAELTLAAPELWHPERPYLYTLHITSPAETVVERVGVRSIRIENSAVLLNGAPVFFRGVNRHDSDPVTGPAVGIDHMLRDLALMRAHNFNAVRTSHYPNAPMFSQLCDEVGMLLIAEADCEAHGAAMLYQKDNDDWNVHLAHWNELLADRPEWSELILDRVRRCVIRDRNRPSVVIWSMGNESAFGLCFERALAWTKTYDPTRLTHYESARYHGSDREYDFSRIDLRSEMYPSLSRVEEYLSGGPDKPYLLCEYVHAMGNGPGDPEDYWQTFRKYPAACGGFVWEWCDHAVYAGQSKDGKAKYLYGGDHGEYPHSGSFCVDGLVGPDRRPHTGLLELWNVNRPARCAYDPVRGVLTVENWLDLLRLDEAVSAHWYVSADGVLTDNGALTLPPVPARGKGEIPLRVPVPEKGKCFLLVRWFSKGERPLLSEGTPLGFDQLPLENADGRNQKAAELLAVPCAARGDVEIKEEGPRYVAVSGPEFLWRFDRATGLPAGLELNGRPMLARPMELNVWRAPTDNDRKIKLVWQAARYDRLQARCRDLAWAKTPDGARLAGRIVLAAVAYQPALWADAVWTVYPDGTLDVHLDAVRDTVFPMLPRFGLRLFLPRQMDRAEWCGLGPMENYADKRRAARYARYSSPVAELHEDYIRPQENGSRGGCDWVTVSGRGAALTAVSAAPFSFNASPYTQEELTEKAHNFELEESGHTVLCLDAAQNGIGSNSCGPQLLEKYRLDAERIGFDLRLIPER